MRAVLSFFTQTTRPSLARIGLRGVSTIEGNEHSIRGWRYGEVELQFGSLIRVSPRWWPRFGSQWEAFQDSYLRNLPRDFCRTYYSFSRRAPGFMSVLYAHSGPDTQYKTLYRAVQIIDAIAQLKNSQAIVCQVMNERATERLMSRWGYVRHASVLGDNHYIKRLKTGY